MISTITITNVNNIDWKSRSVIDAAKIKTRQHDADMDVFTFENIHTTKQRKGNLMQASLFEDVIVENKQKYKILHMLTKNK
jgi:uncharacterized membrane protein